MTEDRVETVRINKEDFFKMSKRRTGRNLHNGYENLG